MVSNLPSGSKLLVSVLEDDAAQADLLKEWLLAEGYRVNVSGRCQDFIKQLDAETPDIALLDWHLPDGTGLDILQHLSVRLDVKLPVIFCTQRNAESDIVTALNAGADDYLQKPIRKAELLARLSALVRRVGLQPEGRALSVGPVTIDTEAEEVTVNGEQIKLTRKDYLVALCLVKHFGKVLSREFLLKEVWGASPDLDTRKVDVHISRVRRALKIHPDMGYVIKNIFQHGYRFEKL